MTFQSKIEQMETLIRTFEPVAGTVTHILLNSWYCAKRLWRTVRERDFLITTGLKSHRWQQLSDYVAGLSEHNYVPIQWPRNDKTVYVHVISTSVRKLYRCQGVIVCHSLDAPLSQARSGPPVIWRATSRPCSPISLRVVASRCFLAMAKRNWAWTTVR